MFPHSCGSHLNGCIAQLQASSQSPCAWRSNGAAGFWMPANHGTAPVVQVGCAHTPLLQVSAASSRLPFCGAGRCSCEQDVTQGCLEQAGPCAGRIQLVKCLAPSWLPQFSPEGRSSSSTDAGLLAQACSSQVWEHGGKSHPHMAQRWCRGRGWLSVHSLVQGPVLLP